MSRQELEGLGEAYLQGLIEAIPAKRAGNPFDVANAVTFLSSHEADFMIGSDIRVGGGFIVHEKWTDDPLFPNVISLVYSFRYSFRVKTIDMSVIAVNNCLQTNR
jgi:hypothetical protein